jgi:hypothetical protein
MRDADLDLAKADFARIVSKREEFRASSMCCKS